MASVGPAVKAACDQALQKLIAMAVAGRDTPLAGARPEDVIARNGRLVLQSDSRRAESFAAIIARNGGTPIEAEAEAKEGEEKEKFATRSWGAVFIEVRVDEALGHISVPRIVATYSVGRLLNAKLAHSAAEQGERGSAYNRKRT